jgi:hypothetical protein
MGWEERSVMRGSDGRRGEECHGRMGRGRIGWEKSWEDVMGGEERHERIGWGRIGWAECHERIR